jgi:hypothetical protein
MVKIMKMKENVMSADGGEMQWLLAKAGDKLEAKKACNGNENKYQPK